MTQYKNAPDVTRERIYLETMERVLGGTDKVIVDRQRGRACCPTCRSARHRATHDQPPGAVR